MKRICLLLLLPVVFFACKKEKASPPDPLAQYFLPGKTDSTDIIANWVLVASRVRFSVGHPDTNWVKVGVTDPGAIIKFTADRVFAFNDNYAWKDQQYDRYRTIGATESNPDSANFRIYATVPPTGNIGIYQSVTAKLLNPYSLLISYMSVDISKQELYTPSDFIIN